LGPSLGSEGLFSPFWPPKVYFFLIHIKFPIDGYITRWTYFGPQIPFSGTEGLFSPFWPPTVYFFKLHVKFPIDGYITRPNWFWALNWALGANFCLFTLKSIYFLHLYKISNRLMPFFIFEPPSAKPKDPADSKFTPL
jgi:hypothetical protein